MAIIRRRDLKNMGEEELTRRLEELKIELMRADIKKATKASGVKIKEIKRTIARILTIKNYKKQGGIKK